MVPPTGFALRALCDHLFRYAWGSYVLLHHEPDDPGVLHIARDPIGMLDVFTWTCGSLRLVASHPEDWISIAPPDVMAIDWGRLAELLAFPGSIGDALPLRGIDTLAAGTLVRLDGRSVPTVHRLWHPMQYCDPHARQSSDHHLGSMVSGCIATWACQAGALAAEISGGFDSALVAAMAPGLSIGFNAWCMDPGGDERACARAVARRLGLALVEFPVAPLPLSSADIADMPIGARPGLGSTSLFHDRALSHHLRDMGLETLMTGQAGDAVFFQPAVPQIASEAPLRHGGALLTLARWTRRPIWHILAHAVRGRAISRRLSPPANGMLAVLVDPPQPPAYDWLDGTAHLPFAKQFQIWALANSRGAFGSSWCGTAVDVIHPLMSQPLVEHALALSIFQLTDGERDRALARRFFTDRLPRVVIERPDKGALTVHFGRRLARSETFLRKFLLGGVLAGERVVDREKLEPRLQPEWLMRNDFYSELLVMLLVEQWARVWQSRLGSLSVRAASEIWTG